MIELGSSMGMRCIVWALITVISVTAFQNALADTGQNASANNSSLNVIPVPAVELISVEGIWKVALEDTEITLGFNQSGDSISGRSKFEGDEPWNGVLVGLLAGKVVNIAMTALQGNVLVSTEITGTISNDVLQGSYVSYDSEGKESNGEVTGTRISLDVSGYTPAEVKAAPTAASAEIEQPQIVLPTQPTTKQQNQVEIRKVQDVNELARGINANILPWSFPL